MLVFVGHTLVTHQLTEHWKTWVSMHKKEIVFFTNFVDFFETNGSKGGTRNPDTRIMIPLSQTKSCFAELTHLSKHRGPRSEPSFKTRASCPWEQYSSVKLPET